MGSVIKKRRKRMSKKKHRKLLPRPWGERHTLENYPPPRLGWGGFWLFSGWFKVIIAAVYLGENGASMPAN